MRIGKNLRKHFTYSNVMSTIACVAAMTTGTAYAAATLTGANIKDGTLTGADIKNGSLSGGDVLDGSLVGTDLAASTVSGNNIKNGTVGGLDVASDAITGNHLGAGSVDDEAIADGSITGDELAAGSVGTSNLAAATISFFTSMSNMTCERSGETGNLRPSWDNKGWSKIFCEIPVAADSYEDNETSGTAAPVVTDNQQVNLYASIDSSTDEDFYSTTLACPSPGLYVGSSSEFVAFDIWDDGVQVADAVTEHNGNSDCGTFIIRAYSPEGVRDAYTFSPWEIM